MFNSWTIKIISGGQTGVDRAALDFALENNISCGGWCPKGRKAEDGKIPNTYPLTEIQSESCNDRTEKNLINSNGTLIIYKYKPDEGTELTGRLCHKLEKPLFEINRIDNNTANEFQNWIIRNQITTLNVAGPRESNEPGIYEYSKNILKSLLKLQQPEY